MQQTLILASSSPYRKELLHRITTNFLCISPDIDETPHPKETAIELVERLAISKAQAVAKTHPQALIIGSDQVCEFVDPISGHTHIVGKPKTHENAFKHLQAVSGNSVTLQTGLALYNAKTATLQSCVVPFAVSFRNLSNELIESYLLADEPYFCAGAVKAESLGIILIEKMHGDDPNALIGLPLIELISMLNNEKHSLFHEKNT